MARYTGRFPLSHWGARLGLQPTLWVLLLINAALFLLYQAVALISRFTDPDIARAFVTSLALPASPTRLFLHPWAPITYMFFHQDFFHILFNMLWLVTFGRLFLIRMPAYRLRNLYLWGGIAGGALYVLAYNVIPYFSPVANVSIALGASAAVMAITIATVLLSPNERVYLYGFIAIRIKWLGVAIIAIDILSVMGSNAGGHIAHLGGAAMGWLYVHSLRHGAYLDHPFAWIASRWAASPRPRPRKTPPKAGSPSSSADQLQAILRKLARGGYSALSAEEKEILFRSRQ